MKNLIIIIVLSFVSFFASAQTSTGAFITVSNKQCEVFAGSRGGLYYINASGNKSYLTDAQTAKIGTVAPAVTKTVVSVPTAAQLQSAHTEKEKEKVLIDNGSTVIYHGVTFTVQTGSRGGRYFEYVNKDGKLCKNYLQR
jgi:hypothetical protein